MQRCSSLGCAIDYIPDLARGFFFSTLCSFECSRLLGKGKRQHFYFAMFLTFLALGGLRLKGNKPLMQ